MRRLRRPLLIALALALTTTAAFVLEGLIDDGAKAETALVLGNEVYADGTLSPRLRARVDHAIGLFEAGRVERILVSGATGASGFNEALAMAAYVRSKCEAPVLVDEDGANTRASAAGARRLLDPDSSIVVVSQYFHVARSRLAVEQAGFERVTGSAPIYFELRDLFSIPRDMIGVLAYALRLR